MPKACELEERWTFTPEAKDVGEYPIEVTVRDESNAVIARARTILRRSQRPRVRSLDDTATRRHSYTEYSVYPQHLLDLGLHDDHLHLKFIGSRGPDNAPATGELRHEGYSGWTAQAFVTLRGPFARSGQYKPLADGKPIRLRRCGRQASTRLRTILQAIQRWAWPDFNTIDLGVNDVFTATDENIEIA